MTHVQTHTHAHTQTNKQTNKQTQTRVRKRGNRTSSNNWNERSLSQTKQPNDFRIVGFQATCNQNTATICSQIISAASSYKIPYIIESKEFNPTQIIRCSKVCKYKKTMKLTSLSKVQSIMLIHEKNNNILVTSQQRKLFHLNPLY